MELSIRRHFLVPLVINVISTVLAYVLYACQQIQLPTTGGAGPSDTLLTSWGMSLNYETKVNYELQWWESNVQATFKLWNFQVILAPWHCHTSRWLHYPSRRIIRVMAWQIAPGSSSKQTNHIHHFTLNSGLKFHIKVMKYISHQGGLIHRIFLSEEYVERRIYFDPRPKLQTNHCGMNTKWTENIISSHDIIIPAAGSIWSTQTCASG